MRTGHYGAWLRHPAIQRARDSGHAAPQAPRARDELAPLWLCPAFAFSQATFHKGTREILLNPAFSVQNSLVRGSGSLWLYLAQVNPAGTEFTRPTYTVLKRKPLITANLRKSHRLGPLWFSGHVSPCFFLCLPGSFEVTVTSVSLPPFVSRRGLSNTNQRLSIIRSLGILRAAPASPGLFELGSSLLRACSLPSRSFFRSVFDSEIHSQVKSSRPECWAMTRPPILGIPS